ncbi:endonuclease [Mariniluteicoccus flavus]
MPRPPAPRRLRAAIATLAAATAAVAGVGLTHAQAAGSLTVAQAIATNSGTNTVTGYVVGQPTATTTVVRSGFPSDYALALADSPTETSTSRMLYVQIPDAFRAQWGLRSNPNLLGKQLSITGTLTPYFSHPGLKNATRFAFATTATPTPTPTPTPTRTATPTPTSTTSPKPTATATTTPGGPTGYYAAAEGKSGTALKAALHGIIAHNQKLSYDQVWTALKDTDEDPNNANNVILLYTGRSQAKSSNGGDPDQWNREHVWAKSHGNFGTATGPGTDVHHLRPTDVSVNSTRSNKDFDLGGSQVGEAPGNYTDGDSFEPRDEVKGDVARMIMYMAVRYEGTDGWPNLEMADQVNTGTAPLHGKMSVLMQWNRQDPPSTFEKRRNEVIFTKYQKNRNPFVDNPAYADLIWK